MKELKKVGRPAILMCFIPATAEIIATVILAPMFFDITHLEATLMGVVLAAVSPAIIVPRMVKLMENEYGINKRIPQLIMAGTSVNGIYVIVLFTSFMGMVGGGNFDFMSLAKIPVAIVIGLLFGGLCGLVLTWLFQKIHMRDTLKVVIILSATFLLVALETSLTNYIPMSGLLAVVALGSTILKKHATLAKRISGEFSKIWVPAEILLFVLVGATVNMNDITRDGWTAVGLIFVVLVVRFSGVLICLIKTPLTRKERLFCGVSYMPKATVQAAIGSLPLAAGVAAGNIILTVAVWAILITAPLGALGIDRLYKKMLVKS
jgi:NhaP-type Na+/H+ or K+/H+ antiporter